MDPSWYLNRMHDLLRTKFGVTYECEPHPGSDIAYSGMITAVAPGCEYRMHFEHWLGDLTTEVVAELIEHAERNLSHPFLLFTAHVPATLGQVLIEHNVNFLDTDGDVHIALGKDFQLSERGAAAPAYVT